MAVTITRTYPTEDDGSGTTGDAIDNDWLESLYVAIDAALAQLLPLAGGTMTGDLKFTDATYDIGKSGATRPRDGFFSRNLVVGGTAAITGTSTTAAITASGLITANAGVSGLFASFSQNSSSVNPLEVAQAHSSGSGMGVLTQGTSGSQYIFLCRSNAGATTVLRCGNDGIVRMGGYGAGTATFDSSGNISSVSDRRYKDRVKPLPYGLAEVLALKPVQHGYNKRSGLERKHLYGSFIAQEVEKVMPLAVGRMPNGYRTLADRPIIGALVNAVRELHVQVEAMKAA